MASARFLISGRVQGVFFRASARARAIELGLSGYARNLPDGRVEVVACGASRVLVEFQRWLQHGPPGARVDGLDREDVVEQNYDSFTTR